MIIFITISTTHHDGSGAQTRSGSPKGFSSRQRVSEQTYIEADDNDDGGDDNDSDDAGDDDDTDDGDDGGNESGEKGERGK